MFVCCLSKWMWKQCMRMFCATKHKQPVVHLLMFVKCAWITVAGKHGKKNAGSAFKVLWIPGKKVNKQKNHHGHSKHHGRSNNSSIGSQRGPVAEAAGTAELHRYTEWQNNTYTLNTLMISLNMSSYKPAWRCMIDKRSNLYNSETITSHLWMLWNRSLNLDINCSYHI